MPLRLSRRRFLQTTAAAGAVGFWTGAAAAADKNKSPNDRLNVGFIGFAGQGDHDMKNVVAAGVNVVALCDVDEKRVGTTSAQYPNAQLYANFRKLRDQKGIDA